MSFIDFDFDVKISCVFCTMNTERLLKVILFGFRSVFIRDRDNTEGSTPMLSVFNDCGVIVSKNTRTTAS